MSFQINLEELKTHLSSPEGQKEIENYYKELEKEELFQKRRFEKFNKLTSKEQDLFLTKLKTYYESEKYLSKWFDKKGYFPIYQIYELLVEYAKIYGEIYDSENWSTTYKINNSWFLIDNNIGGMRQIYIEHI